MHILGKKTEKKNTKKKKLDPVSKDRGGQNHKPGLIKPRYRRTAREPPRESRVGEEEKYIKTEERDRRRRI